MQMHSKCKKCTAKNKFKNNKNLTERPSTVPLQAIDKPNLDDQERRIKPLNNPDDSWELTLLHKLESFPWLLVCVLNNRSNPVNLTHPGLVHRLVFHQSGVWCKCNHKCRCKCKCKCKCKCRCKYKCKCKSKCECKCPANAKNAHATKNKKILKRDPQQGHYKP